MPPFSTQYTNLLLELEQLERHIQDNKKATGPDATESDICRHPTQPGGRRLPDGSDAENVLGLIGLS